MKKLSKPFLIAWYIAVIAYALFLIITLPFAIHSPSLSNLHYPIIDIGLQDSVAIMSAVFLPVLWSLSGREKWFGVYRVVALIFLTILIIGFFMLDIQYTF